MHKHFTCKFQCLSWLADGYKDMQAIVSDWHFYNQDDISDAFQM